MLVWITLDLTDWQPAVGLVGLSLGITGLLVALPAGAWSDRLDRRTMFVRLSAATAVLLVSATIAVATGTAASGSWRCTPRCSAASSLRWRLACRRWCRRWSRPSGS